MDVIVVCTVRDYIKYRHAVYTHCPVCGQLRDVDLQRLVRRGRGDKPLHLLRIRCLRCSLMSGRDVIVRVMTAGRRHSGLDRPPPDNVVQLRRK
jgi:hypothetical protein